MKYKKIFKIIILLIFILLLIFAILFLKNTFRIKKVIINANEFPMKGLYLLNNSYSFYFDDKKKINEIISQNRDIYTINLKKILPDRLVITPLFRTPVAKVYNQPDEYNLVDKEGYLLTFTEELQDLPSIYAYGVSLTIYSKPDWRIIKSLNYLKRMSERGIPVENIEFDLNNDLFILNLKAGEVVAVPQISAPSFVTDSLQLIVSRFRIEGKIVSKIDFTSDKPVVTLRNED